MTRKSLLSAALTAALLAATALVAPPAYAISGTIYVSQLGGGLTDTKFALLGTASGTTLDETAFRVIRVGDSTTVYTGSVVAWTGANEWHGNNTAGDVYTLDFSAWTAVAGKYRIDSNGLQSYPFEVGNHAFNIRSWDPLYWWRVWDIGRSISWTALDGTADSHGLLSTDDGRQGTTSDPGGGETLLQQPPAFPTGTHIPTSGGWLDAGDLNTYMGTTPWATYLLLLTYEDHQTYWNKLDADANAIPDIVDQSKVGLDWMLKMRGKDTGGSFDGSCYERVWKSFSDYTTDNVVGTSDDRPVDTDKWADLCIRVAQAGAVGYRVWNAYDPTAAATYKTMAEQAYTWSTVPGQADKPQFSLGGCVYWSDLASNRALAATELYRASCLTSCVAGYLTDATNLIDPQAPTGTWTDPANFPVFFPSTWRNSGTLALQRFHDYGYGTTQLRADIVTAVQSTYDNAITNANAGPYKVWRGGFAFGPNSLLGSLAMDAVWLYRKTGNTAYYDFAANQEGWIWGRNNVNTSFWATSRIAGYPTTAFSYLTGNKTIEHFILPGAHDRCGGNGIPDFGASAACPSYSPTNPPYGEPTINSAALNLRAVTELQFAKVPAGDITAPATPTGLTATAGGSSITLDWTDSAAGDLLGYQVHRSTTAGFTPSGTTLLKLDVPTSSYVDTTAQAGLTYYYKVVATDTSDNSSAASAQASAQIVPSGLFSDTFEDGDSAGWTTTSGTWSVVTDGTHVFKQTAAGTHGKASAGNASWTDYTVQARIKMHQLPATTAAGITARYTDDNNLYWLRLHSSGTVELYKLVGSTATLLDSAGLSVAVDTWYTLRLDVDGSSLTGYVDGVPRVAATDASLPAGKIGVRSYQQSFSVDDVSVTAPAIFEDDFEDGNSAGWTVFGGGSQSWAVVTDGTSVWKQQTAGATGKVYTGSGWTDVAVEARVRMNELPATTAAGITARHDTATESHYWLRLHSSGTVQLYRVNGAVSTLLAQASYPGGFTTSAWYTVKLVVTGSATVSLTGFVNGVQYLTTTDASASRLLSGGIGARSYQQSFSIDDVTVTSG